MAFTVLTGTGDADAGSGVTPVKHASTAVGDLLLFIMIESRAAGIGTGSETPPSGWTERVMHTHTNNTCRLSVWSFVDDGNAVPTVTGGSSVNSTLANVITIQGGDYATAHGLEVIGTPSSNTASTDIPIGNGITTLTNGALVIGIGGRVDNWGSNVANYNATTDIDTLGTVSGITFAEAFEANTSNDGDTGFVADYGEKATAGSVAAATFTWATNTPGVSTDSIGVYLAVKPTGGGGGAPTVKLLGSTGVGT